MQPFKVGQPVGLLGEPAVLHTWSRAWSNSSMAAHTHSISTGFFMPGASPKQLVELPNPRRGVSPPLNPRIAVPRVSIGRGCKRSVENCKGLIRDWGGVEKRRFSKVSSGLPNSKDCRLPDSRWGPSVENLRFSKQLVELPESQCRGLAYHEDVGDLCSMQRSNS